VPFSKQVLLKIIDGLTLKSKQPGCLIFSFKELNFELIQRKRLV